MPHGHGVDNCILRFCRKGRQLDLGESRSPTQIFLRNQLPASRRFWAYVCIRSGAAGDDGHGDDGDGDDGKGDDNDGDEGNREYDDGHSDDSDGDDRDDDDHSTKST